MKTHAIVLLATVAIGLPACTGEVESWDDSEDNLGEVSLEVAGSNNGSNGIDTKFLKGPERLPLVENYGGLLTSYPLNGAALSTNIKNLLCADPTRVTNGYLMKKIVQCALNTSQSVTFTCSGSSYSIVGWTGLATNWGNAPCDAICQAEVSACVIAESNYAGEEVPIDLASDTSGMVMVKRSGFDRKEGAYWGNIFSPTPDIQGCYAPDSLTYRYTSAVLGSNLSLMNRACYSFGSAARKCLMVGGNYFDNLDPSAYVRPCSTECSVTSNGNYIGCRKNATPNITTNHVVTVRRQNTLTY